MHLFLTEMYIDFLPHSSRLLFELFELVFTIAVCSPKGIREFFFSLVWFVSASLFISELLEPKVINQNEISLVLTLSVRQK